MYDFVAIETHFPVNAGIIIELNHYLNWNKFGLFVNKITFDHSELS